MLGTWYQSTFAQKCPRTGSNILCPIIHYSGGVVVDNHGRLPLTPWSFTLGIFTPAIYSQKERSLETPWIYAFNQN
jgi:hypothetical protein